MEMKGKKGFLDELSDRSGFTKKDTREFYNAFESIVVDLVLSQQNFHLQGLFSIHFSDLPPRRGYNAVEGHFQEYDGCKRIIISPAKKLKLALKEILKEQEEISNA
jgi:nucleoid DNA-binding protein